MIQPLNPFNPVNQINFGYKSVLKDEYRDNPEMRKHVKKGLYGGDLKEGITLEHVHPHTFHGPNALSNYALATAKNNQARGDAPLANFLTRDMFEKYAREFEGWHAERFNNYDYIVSLATTIQREGVDLGLPDVPVGDMVKQHSSGIFKNGKKLSAKQIRKMERIARKQARKANKNKIDFTTFNPKEISGNLQEAFKELPSELGSEIKEVGKHLNFKA